MSLKDKILGRERLKRRIEELEKKLESAEEKRRKSEERMEKERERAKKAITEKQELNERINRKEDKIESLKGEMREREYIEEKVKGEVQNNRISKSGLSSLVKKLRSVESDEENLLTAYISEGSGLQKLSGGVVQNDLTLNQLKTIQSLDWETGKVLFHSRNLATLLTRPPLPIRSDEWNKSNRFETSRLEKQLDQEVGLIFMSAGGSAVSVFNDAVEEFELVESDIKNKHSKGGFSQGRFERKREEEIKGHVEKVEGVAEEMLEGMDTVAVSGSEDMINLLSSPTAEESNRFVRKLDVSSIRNEEDVERAFKEFWKSEVRKI